MNLSAPPSHVDMSGRYAGFVSTSHDLLESDRSGRVHLADWVGVGDMIAIVTEQISAPAEGMHRAISGRWLGMFKPWADPGKRLVDALTA